MKEVGLLFIDIQEKLFPKIHGHAELLQKLLILKEAATLLQIPVIHTEQYPQGLGKTIPPLADSSQPFEKTAFSCLKDDAIKQAILSSPVKRWIIAGIESHVCVLQTAIDLLAEKREVIVPADAISSRNRLDHEMALQELRALGAHVTSLETLLFKLLVDAKHPQFKAISRLIK